MIKRISWLTIFMILFFVNLAHSIEFRVEPSYSIQDSQMYLRALGGAPVGNGVGTGLIVGPGFTVYHQNLGVMGLGFIGVVGATSLNEGARFTAVPMFGPIGLFNNAVVPMVGYSFADSQWVVGASISLGKVLEARKKLP